MPEPPSGGSADPADKIVERIIFLDAIPEVNVALKPNLGKNVQSQLEIDLADELEVIKEYNHAVGASKKDQPVLLLVDRNGNSLFLAV